MAFMDPPPTFPAAPNYNIFIGAVNDSTGSPVNGASFVLVNVDKLTQSDAIVSNEVNSNIILNVADAGAWDDGDLLQINTSYGGESDSTDSAVSLNLFPMGRDLATITLSVKIPIFMHHYNQMRR